MQLSNIVLNSFNPENLSKYVTELFDKEVEVFDNEYYMQFGGINFIFKEEVVGESDSEHTVMEFTLSSIDELQDLLKKVQFYHYRLNNNANDDHVFDIPEIQGDQRKQFFEVRDPDDRLWRFTTFIQ